MARHVRLISLLFSKSIKQENTAKQLQHDTNLQISELRKGIDNDTKDDVKTNGCKRDEEGDLVDGEIAEVEKRILQWMAPQDLKNLKFMSVT